MRKPYHAALFVAASSLIKRARARLKPSHSFAVAAVAAALLPTVLPGQYAVYLAVVIGINTIVALGLNLLMGYAGQVSLGQAAFVGIGAYASAVLTTKVGISPWLGIGAGAALGGLTAAAVGIPLLKLRGHYLAMGTLGFGMIMHIVMVQWEGLTEGTIGIMSIPPLSLGGFAFNTELRMYYLVAASVILCMALASNIINSRVGRAMRAVHGSEVAAQTSGVDTARYKLQVDLLSGAMAGFAGSLYAHHATYVPPDCFGFQYSIQLVVMVVLGGMASNWGAIFGAGAVMLIGEQLRRSLEFSPIIFGFVLI
ncbi:MAG: branched-chain amino acid ABC transporter permease, partial [Armatimonadetes bacterium]|nr:branched-chain amino acid ABC transporter permease [Armatimonadota bacterium]